jgi:hypothetical protein
MPLILVLQLHLAITCSIWVRERTHLPSALPSNHTSDNLLPNRISDRRTDRRTDGHTQEDTHYTEWYPSHWVITDTPKRIPITLSDTHYYTEWYQYLEWFFLSLKILTTHPRVYPLQWGTLFSSQTNWTLNDTHDTEGYPLTLSDTHYPEFF